jgi:DNA-directed RNA polymerase specialized sigma subunit
MSRQENPAKVFLRRYKALCGRVDALQRAIDDALARATNTGITLKEIKVLSSPAEHDPMARDVCSAVDACEILYQYKAEAETALREILAAIDSLKDERQKEVLTRKYINGETFTQVAENMNYSEPGVYVIHGRALLVINKWLERRAEHGDRSQDGLYAGDRKNAC